MLRRKSRTPRKAATASEMPITSIVFRTVSFRLGQMTRFISSRDSCKYVMSFSAIVRPKNPLGGELLLLYTTSRKAASGRFSSKKAG